MVGLRPTSTCSAPTTSEWASVNVFHITGVGAHFHPTGSGDTAVQWVEQLIFLLFAVGGALLWTAIAALRSSKRTEYQTLYAWLRFLLRLTCAMFMFNYGLDKLLPSQMQPPSMAILNEPVGNMSPMTMLWSLIGLNPGYEVVCGAAEVIGGVLLLFRRTALAGALLASFVLTNVLLYNMFFDVPVKLLPLICCLRCFSSACPMLPPCGAFSGSTSPPRPPASGFPRPAVAAFALLPAPWRSST